MLWIKPVYTLDYLTSAIIAAILHYINHVPNSNSSWKG